MTIIPPVSNAQLLFEHHFPKLPYERDAQGRYVNRTTRQVFRGFNAAIAAKESEITNMKVALNAKQGLVDKLEADLDHLKKARENASR